MNFTWPEVRGNKRKPTDSRFCLWWCVIVQYRVVPDAGQRVEPGLRCTNVKPRQPPLNQGSEAIKPPFDHNVRFRPNAGSTWTRSRGHLRFGGPAMVQSVKYELKFIWLRTLSEDWNTKSERRLTVSPGNHFYSSGLGICPINRWR